MSIENKTTKEISDNIIAQLEATLNQTIPLLPKSFLRVLAKTIAAVYVILYKYCGFIALQIFVDTASDQPTTINGREVVPLTEWGRLIGVGDPTEATAAELNVEVIVENQTGFLPSGSQLIGDLNGVTYLTIGSAPLSGPTITITARAVSDQTGGDGSGVIGNLDPGAELSFANPLPNVARVAVVASQAVTGANGESTEAYRQRVLDRFQKRPQGGAYADYEIWAEEAAGIINAYPYTSVNPGQVDVYLEATPESSGNPDGIPTAAQLQAALDLIDFDENGLATRRPANALANTFPITRTGFDVEVDGVFGVPDLAQTVNDIEAALIEYFAEREPFIPGLSVPPRLDRITESGIGGIVEDIVTAAGGVFVGVTVLQSAVPINIYGLQEGEKAKLDSLTVN